MSTIAMPAERYHDARRRCRESDEYEFAPRNAALAAQHSVGILTSMSSVEEIEAAIQQLSPDEMAAFRAWYAEFDAAAWDRQIAEDEAAGRLDWLINEALDDLDAGRCTDR